VVKPTKDSTAKPKPTDDDRPPPAPSKR